MKVSENTTVTDDDFHANFSEELISILFMSLAIVLTLTGNTIVILAVYTQKSLHAVQNYFLVSLAVADLTVAVFVMPLSASYYVKGYWDHGYVICDIWRTLDVCLCTASILNLCAIAVDRYWAITDPVAYAPRRTKKRICSIIAFVWMLSFLISVPPLFGWDERQKYRSCTLSQQRAYIILSSTTSFYLPFLVMCVVYLRIYGAIRVRGRVKKCPTFDRLVQKDKNGTNKPTETLHMSQSAPANMESMNGLTVNVIVSDHSSDIQHTFRQKIKERIKINIKKERRAARTLGIILGAFIVCWLPFFLMYVILPFCPSCHHPGKRIEAAITWIGYVNSSCNPIVYTVFNRDFRSAFVTFLFGKCIRYRRKRRIEKKLMKKLTSN